MLLVVPVTLAIAKELEVPVYPFLFAEVFASNIGGTATLIGDPPNILIGSLTGLDFNAFVIHLAPIVIVPCGPFVDNPTTRLPWRKSPVNEVP